MRTGKLSFVSIVFGLIQVAVGIGSLIYVFIQFSKIGSFDALTFDERDRYSGMFLKYCGGGAVHIFTGSCILTRQSAAPTLAFLAGTATILARLKDVVQQPDIRELPTQIAVFAFVYVLWFMARGKEFSDKPAP